MSGFGFVKSTFGFSVPYVMRALIGKSTKVSSGDVLVRTTAAAYTSGPPVIRPLLSGDTVTASNGLLGVSLFEVETDANANIIKLTPPSTIDSGALPHLTVPSMAHIFFVKDTNSGYFYIPIAIFTVGTIFRANMQSDDAAAPTLIGKAVGVAASAASPPVIHTINDDALDANAPFIVTSVPSDEEGYNQLGGKVYISIRDGFASYETGGVFTT